MVDILSELEITKRKLESELNETKTYEQQIKKAIEIVSKDIEREKERICVCNVMESIEIKKSRRESNE